MVFFYKTANCYLPCTLYFFGLFLFSSKYFRTPQCFHFHYIFFRCGQQVINVTSIENKFYIRNIIFRKRVLNRENSIDCFTLAPSVCWVNKYHVDLFCSHFGKGGGAVWFISQSMRLFRLRYVLRSWDCIYFTPPPPSVFH